MKTVGLGRTILESPRASFRFMEEADAPALMRVIHKPDGSPCDEAYAKRWVDWCVGSYQKQGFGQYAVLDKATGELIGSAGPSMQYIDDAWKPEIGYHLREDHRGKGLGKEIARALRDYCFTHFPFDELYSYMDEDNVASYKTAEAMDMTFRQIYVTKSGERCRVYSLTRKEWEELIKE